MAALHCSFRVFTETPVDASAIDHERVIIDPVKFGIVISKSVAPCECDPPFRAGERQYDGVGDDGPKSCASPYIFLNDMIQTIENATMNGASP